MNDIPQWMRDFWAQHGPEVMAEQARRDQGEHDGQRVGRKWLAANTPLSNHRARVLARQMRRHPDSLLGATRAPTARTETLEVAPVDDAEVPIGELIEARVRASERHAKKQQIHQRSVTLEARPFGLAILGDPHVDNEGCDWGLLHEHVEMIRASEGVFAACVGDMQDNWIGRLQRLYAKTSCAASDGWRLSKWLLESLQWIALVSGNHDGWAHAPGHDPLAWITRDAKVSCYAPHGIRITIGFRDRPDLEPLIWILRHDFKGRSWYHPTHGPHKEATLDGRAHLLTAGHIHQWGVLRTEQRHERVTTSLRIRGYKRGDDHARALGFYEQHHGAMCLVVVDPERDGPGRVSVWWDLEQGLEYLAMLRAQ